MIPFNPDKCECWECHKTFPYFGVESPMICDELWRIVSKNAPRIEYCFENGYSEVSDGFLCKDCMEKKLGRSLTYDDLKKRSDGSDVPFNYRYIEKYCK